MTFLKNAWYQAAWSEEVPQNGSLTRTIAAEAILFFRDRLGVAHAFADRCPHRFAPLSRGRLEGNIIRCGYHGLGFDHSGQCILNPHGPVPRAMKIQNFPLVERFRGLWIWMGDPTKADPLMIRDLSFIDEVPCTADIHGHMWTKANYQLLADNILDLSHTNFLHANSIGGLPEGVTMEVQEIGNEVVVRWVANSVAPNPFQSKLMPGVDRIDNWVEVSWMAPAVMILDTGGAASGTPHRHDDHSLSLHSITPETETTSHYFYCSTRRTDLYNEELTAATRSLLEKAFFHEDKPMIEAQQQNMGTADLWALKPVLLPIDRSAIHARRKLESMIMLEETDPIVFSGFTEPPHPPTPQPIARTS